MELVYYAGCNYYINDGSDPEQPLGTATSMHDCEGCDHSEYCGVKQTTDVFVLDEEALKKGVAETKAKARELESLRALSDAGLKLN